jgi:D-alanine-D-alanine ligase
VIIGFTYDTCPSSAPESSLLDSVAAEYEDPATLEWIRSELCRFGTVCDLPWGPEAAAQILARRFDLVFNITEGIGGRNRESLVPSVCELAGVPYTGSDALALGISLDKEYTKILARHLDIPTPSWMRVGSLSQVTDGLPGDLEYPVIVKPVTGGSSMGVHQFSRATNDTELYHAAEWVLTECNDDALVEEFVAGREFVAGLLSGEPRIDLPVAELTFPEGGPDTFYSVEWKSRHQKQVVCPASIPAETASAMQAVTRRMFDVIGASDLCRADFRLAEDGTPQFIEINPLPGLSPYYSVYPVQVRAAGEHPRVIVDRLIAGAQSDARTKGAQNIQATTPKGQIHA